MSEDQPTPMRRTARRRCAVFLGSNTFVELEDDPSTITLEDLCEAFSTPWESGMHVKHRATGRVVATLPFEPLPSLEDVSDVPETAEPALTDDAEDEEDETARTYAVVYDLVTPTARDDDGDSELAAAVAAAGLSDPLAASAEGAPSIGETMRQLVELGAAELLTAESASVAQSRREYNPADAPGLLRRIVYPASQYSPYRLSRDPLSDGRHSLFRTTAAAVPWSSPTSASGAHAQAMQAVGEGGPYTSYLDSYSLSGPVGVTYAHPLTSGKSALVMPLTDEELARFFSA
ncbi:hypothetical protein NESM_000135300 [Novymonas esmeraldas]|uniref:Uncharacterized protein n=1 Tax=Novymonas esmeraldas TaxID=1808958 RepID=A0AAW0F5R3_9TRYP